MAESELQARIGIYFDESTRGLAEIELSEGVLRWKETERTLVPVGEGTFAAVRDASRVDVRFDGTTMSVQSPGQREFHYERVAPAAPTLEELARHIGLYRCSELDVTYHVELDENQKLEIVTPAGRGTLDPVFVDGFRWNRDTIVFQRNDEGRVRGFELAFGRARNFVFERL